MENIYKQILIVKEKKLEARYLNILFSIYFLIYLLIKYYYYHDIILLYKRIYFGFIYALNKKYLTTRIYYKNYIIIISIER